MLTVAKKHQQERQDGQKAGQSLLPDAVEVSNVPAPDDDFLEGPPTTDLAQPLPVWDWNGVLAQLYNPGVLEEVAFSGAGKVNGSFDIFADLTAGPSDERAIPGQSEEPPNPPKEMPLAGDRPVTGPEKGEYAGGLTHWPNASSRAVVDSV